MASGIWFTLLVLLCWGMASADEGSRGRTAEEGGMPEDAPSLPESTTNRRRMVRPNAITFTAGKFRGEFLKSDNFSVAFEVGSRLRKRSIECRLLRIPRTVVFSMHPCTSPIRLKNRLLRDGKYRLTVTGIRRRRRKSEKRSKRKVKVVSTWTLDTVPPKTRIVQVNETGPRSLRVVFDGRDRWHVSSFDCSVDQDPWDACTSPYTVRAERNGNASHSFRVRAVDGAGNVDLTPAEYRWTEPEPEPEPEPVPEPVPGPEPEPEFSPPLLSDPASVSDFRTEPRSIDETSSSDSSELTNLIIVLAVLLGAGLLCFVCFAAGYIQRSQTCFPRPADTHSKDRNEKVIVKSSFGEVHAEP